MRSDVFARPPRAGIEGQPVMLIPGFLAPDRSLAHMAGWLRRAGYAPTRAGMSMNSDCSQAESERLETRLARAVEKSGHPALVIGHSRGGMFARVLAVRQPSLVAGIVTLGGPFVDPGRYVHPLIGVQAALIGALGDLRVPKMLSNDCGDPRMFSHGPTNAVTRIVSRRARARLARNEGRVTCCSPFWDDFYSEFPEDVHFASLYSRSDGVVDWHAMLDPGARPVEVESSHFGMAANVSTFQALARELPAMAERPA